MQIRQKNKVFYLRILRVNVISPLLVFLCISLLFCMLGNRIKYVKQYTVVFDAILKIFGRFFRTFNILGLTVRDDESRTSRWGHTVH